MEATVVLGLSVNARMLGLAVIFRNRLIDYHVQLRKDAWSPRKRELILTSLQPWCDCYSIKNVALSIQYENQTSKQSKELLESLKNYFSEKNITVCLYTPQTLYSFYEETETKNKKEMMRRLASLYPELSVYFKKEMNNKNKYYVKLFEAVEVGRIHYQVMRGKK